MVDQPTFDPLRNSRFLWQIAKRFALYAVVGGALEVVLLIAGLLLSLLGGVAIAAFSGVVSLIAGLVLLLLFWVLPVPAMMAFDSKLISGQAPFAGHAMAFIRQAFERHQPPCDSFQLRSLTLPTEGRRDYLEIRRGDFAGYISCFPHGNDLYYGWTFWIYMSPLRMLIMRVSRMIENLQGRGNDLYQTLRYESVRATVGVIHICASEGVEDALSATHGGAPISLPSTDSVPIG